MIFTAMFVPCNTYVLPIKHLNSMLLRNLQVNSTYFLNLNTDTLTL